MPQHRCFRDAVSLCPALLKTQLPAQAYKSSDIAVEQNPLDPCEVNVVLNLTFYLVSCFFNVIQKCIAVVDNLKLPVSGKVMGSVQNLFFKYCKVVVKQVALKCIPEITFNRTNIILKLFKNPFI